jgi:hypothetical protein
LNYNKTVVPEGNLTTVNVEYKVLEEDCYFVYDEGVYQSYSDYSTNWQLLSGKTLKGLMIFTKDASFIIDPSLETAGSKMVEGDVIKADPKYFTNCVLYSTSEEAVLDFNGLENTNNIINDLRSPQNQFLTSPLYDTITSRSFTINGENKTAYFASFGEVYLILLNLEKLKTMITHFEHKPPYITNINYNWPISSTLGAENNTLKSWRHTSLDLSKLNLMFLNNTPAVIYTT